VCDLLSCGENDAVDVRVVCVVLRLFVAPKCGWMTDAWARLVGVNGWPICLLCVCMCACMYVCVCVCGVIWVCVCVCIRHNIIYLCWCVCVCSAIRV